MADDVFSVYEIVNPRLQEVLVGVTGFDTLEELRSSHSVYPPVWMTRWDPGDEEYRFIERGLPLANALAFAKSYVESGGLKGYKAHLIG